MLALNKIIGINGNMKNIIQYSPDNNFLFYAIGGMVIKKNLKTNEIIYKKLHDNNISCLNIDPSSKYIVTGQVGSQVKKEPYADLVISKFENLEEVYRFSEAKIKIIQAKFNENGKFLAVISNDNRITILNTSEFYKVISQFFEFSFNDIQWGCTYNTEKMPQYTLLAINNFNIYQFNLKFELGNMKYFSKVEMFKGPNTRLERKYNCSVNILSQNIFIGGTTGGEISIYDIKNKKFNTIVQIGKSSLQCMVKIDDNNIFCGFDDGSYNLLNGSYNDWKSIFSGALNKRINNMIYFDNIIKAIVDNGDIYNINIKNNNVNLEENSNSSPINDFCYNKDLNYFGTIDVEGECKIWDILNKKVICSYKNYKLNNLNNGGNVITIDNDGSCAIGFLDGNVKSFKIDKGVIKNIIWEILPAHNGKVTAIYLNHNYLITGGEDKMIRIWSRNQRQLITEINFHSKDVVKIFPDFNKENIIHSCSYDKQILSYDLKKERMHQLHTVKNGIINDMTQKKDTDFELITCGFNNGVLFWDSDILDSIKSINYKKNIKSIEISPCNNFLAVGTEDSFIAIFDIKSSILITEIIGHSKGINRLTWVNSEKLVTSSLDGSICIWNFNLK